MRTNTPAMDTRPYFRVSFRHSFRKVSEIGRGDEANSNGAALANTHFGIKLRHRTLDLDVF